MSRPSLLVRMRLLAQRSAHRLPLGVRRALGRVLPPFTPRLDPWEERLTSSAMLRFPPAPPATVSPRARVEAPSGPRCLLLTDSLDSGGVDQFVAFLARRLPDHGFRVAVGVAASEETRRRGRSVGMVADALREEGVAVLRADDPHEARRMFAGWRPDVVGLHAAAWNGAIDLADAGIPLVETLHGPHNLTWEPDTGLFPHLSAVRRLAAVSGLVAEQIVALAPGPRPLVTVIPNGVDTARVSRIDRRTARDALGLESERLILSLTRLSAEKNGYGLQSAFDDLADVIPDAHLLICGRPDDHAYAAQMLALRDRMRHGDRVHLRSATPRADVLLAAADLFALDSYFEGWSLATMEALGSGVPVVSSDVGGAREQLQGGVPRGRMVSNPQGDPVRVDWESIVATRFMVQRNRDELVATMAGVLDGSIETASRAAISDFAIENYSDDRCVEQHARILAEAMG